MTQQLERYLETVDRSLRPMPASERVDIVREIKSELLELEAQGLGPEDITARLGAPKDLAAAYLSDVIAQDPRFSWKHLGSVVAFYSLAGLSGMIVLPTTSILAATFLLCGTVIPAVGLLTLLTSLVGINVPWVMMQIGSWTAPPLVAFPISVLTGLLFLLAGRGLWKVTVGFVRMIGQRRREMA